MCGRYTHLFTWRQLHRLLGLVRWPETELAARYNVAPTQDAPVALVNEAGERVGAMLRWGLVPSWAGDASIGSRLINARAETAHELPAFRAAMSRRRCLVPVSGFYEWKAVPGRKAKQPHWIGRVDREPFMFAGLWESWRKDGGRLDTFTILTTEANDLLRPIHPRMPVVIAPVDFEAWLDPKITDGATLRALLGPRGTEGMEAHPVGTRVNGPAVDDSSLLDRACDAESDDSSLGTRQDTLWGDVGS